MAVVAKMEVPIQGMDCAECTMHVHKAIAAIPGVRSVDVLLTSEKALVQLDPQLVDLGDIRKAVEAAGYAVPEAEDARAQPMESFTRPILRLLGFVFGVVVFVVVVGEWLGLFEIATEWIPWPVWLAIVLAGGYPVFRNVIRAALNRQVIAHTLMTLGVIAAVAVGEWATAAVIVFFMRVGDYVEHFTAERARRAVKDLTAMAPQTARLEQSGVEEEVPVSQVRVDDVVIVRPGERIPVDGAVIAGFATVDQATITGEAMPVEAGPGSHVYAATLVRLGSLRIRATQVGADSTFGRVIKLVEEAEAHRAEVQRIADKFSAYYLPVVAGVALLTFLIRRDPMATAAVLVVACSCSFALATPIAMLASIGSGAQRGVMIKGGKYLELLCQADVLLIDKTGTLTLGKPKIVDFRFFDAQLSSQFSEGDILRLAGTAERYSEHPLAEAIRQAAHDAGVSLDEPHEFEAIPGKGVRAMVQGHCVEVGNRRMFEDELAIAVDRLRILGELEAQGKTLLLVALDGELVCLLAALDTLRPEVPQALQMVYDLGLRQIVLLTGDHQRAAKALVAELGESLDLQVRADMLPEDKIQVVKDYQSRGHVVVMVGDGVNDAPALAQADVGIAMGAAGSDIAIEAAHIALMRDDWRLVPECLHIARRTMSVVRLNIAFTTVYNVLGLSLAALGFLPPILAAAAQSLPDLGILANSSRLLRQKS
ncbi:MAG: copper-translocating P-type ATPase [Chloroflexi bacterium RBG_16_57_11]|nr:MAG: copper-translocating P-type ATPase [Chloroflexi bacterium RBG_16_57_11]